MGRHEPLLMTRQLPGSCPSMRLRSDCGLVNPSENFKVPEQCLQGANRAGVEDSWATCVFAECIIWSCQAAMADRSLL